jgi:8-oxo-dGTP pyrophosphatase MutT (NUDIX family)
MSEPEKIEKEADHHPYRRPVDAATLILVDRTAATPKVLVGKRHDKVVFMPGKFVFPGGRVDKTDNRVPVAAPIPRHARVRWRSPRSARPVRKPVFVLAARVTARRRHLKARGNLLPTRASCPTRPGFF